MHAVSLVYVKVVAAYCDLAVSGPHSVIPQFRSSIGIMCSTEHRRRHDIHTNEAVHIITCDCVGGGGGCRHVGNMQKGRLI